MASRTNPLGMFQTPGIRRRESQLVASTVLVRVELKPLVAGGLEFPGGGDHEAEPFVNRVDVKNLPVPLKPS
jgi:hypothetical protein